MADNKRRIPSPKEVWASLVTTPNRFTSETEDRFHYNADGSEKRGHKTEPLAVMQIKSMIRAGKAEAGELWAYPCPTCGQWHVGHPRICLTCFVYFAPATSDQHHCEDCTAAPGDRR